MKWIGVCLLILILITALPALASTTSDGIVYIINNGYAYITGYTGQASVLTIPATLDGMPVRSISNGAFFNCASLPTVIIPENVTSIGNEAFARCSALSVITIPNSVTSIGNEAFARCSALSVITIPNSVTSIGKDAFANCTAITEMTLPVQIYDRNTLCCAKKITITAGDGSKPSSSWYSAGFNSTLETVVMTPGVKYIQGYAFRNCTSLSAVTIPYGVTSIGVSAFYGCTSLTTVNIPISVNIIDDEAFSGCSNLSAVSIPSLVTTIGESAFSGCSSLPAMTIPNHVTSVGSGAFSSLQNELTLPAHVYRLSVIGSARKVTITTGNGNGIPDSSYSESYVNNTMKELVIEPGVRSVGNAAFWNCVSLTVITIPGGVTHLGDNVFHGCTAELVLPAQIFDKSKLGPVKKVTITAGNGSAIPDITGGITNRALETIIIHNGVKGIGSGAFSGCTAIAEITLPAQLFNYSRIGCAKKLTITGDGNNGIPENTSGYGNQTLEMVVIEGGVRYVGNYSFQKCASLSTVTILNGVQKINDGAFHSCTSLSSLTMPDTMTWIGGMAFYGCSSLTAITVPNNVTGIGESAFSGCTALETLYLPNGYTLPQTAIRKNGSMPYYIIGSFDARNQNVFIPLEAPFMTLHYDLGYGMSLLSCSPVSESVVLPEGIDALDNTVWSSILPKTMRLPSTLKWLTYGSLPASLESLVIPGTQLYMIQYEADETLHVYCVRESTADLWAQESHCEITYLDGAEPIETFAPPADIHLVLGRTYLLEQSIYVTPASRRYTFTASIDDPETVSLDSANQLRALKRGDTTLHVQCAEVAAYTADVRVHVVPPLTDFSINPETVYVMLGGQGKATPGHFIPADAKPDFIWEIEEPMLLSRQIKDGVICVSEFAEIGCFTVAAISNCGLRRECTLQIVREVTKVEFDQDNYGMKESERLPVRVYVTADQNTYENVLVTYTSSNPAIVSVSDEGIMKAHGAGIAIITAMSCNGLSDQCTVTVEDMDVLELPAATVTLDAEALRGTNAEAVVIPENCLTIGSMALADCARLAHVYIPMSVATIAEDAFTGSTGITIHAPEGSEAQRFAENHAIPFMAD